MSSVETNFIFPAPPFNHISGICYNLEDTWPAVTRVLSRGRKRPLGMRLVPNAFIDETSVERAIQVWQLTSKSLGHEWVGDGVKSSCRCQEPINRDWSFYLSPGGAWGGEFSAKGSNIWLTSLWMLFYWSSPVIVINFVILPPMCLHIQWNLWLQLRLVSDHLSSATSFPKY